MEVWKSVVGYEGLYEVSSLGRVKSLERKCNTRSGIRTVPEKILVNGLDSYGYYQVNLYVENIRNTWKVHRLECLAFLPNPENKRSINHKNGVKTDNRLENLEWSTEKENTVHAHKNGLARGRRGEEHGQTNLTEIQAREIKYNHDDKTGVELSKMYGITTSSVSAIRNGKRWKYI